MKIEEVKRVEDQRPFVPFEIRTADGEEHPMDHPDAVAWSSEQPRELLRAPRGMAGVAGIGAGDRPVGTTRAPRPISKDRGQGEVKRASPGSTREIRLGR